MKRESCSRTIANYWIKTTFTAFNCSFYLPLLDRSTMSNTNSNHMLQFDAKRKWRKCAIKMYCILHYTNRKSTKMTHVILSATAKIIFQNTHTWYYHILIVIRRKIFHRETQSLAKRTIFFQGQFYSIFTQINLFSRNFHIRDMQIFL